MYIYIILARDITDIFASYFLKSPQVFLFHLRVFIFSAKFVIKAIVKLII